MLNSRDNQLEKQLMSILWRNRNNRVVVSAVSIKLDESRDNEIMAVVDEFIGLFKRLLACYEVRCRGGEMIRGTYVILSCGFRDACERFVANSDCFEKIDFFGQICKEKTCLKCLRARKQAQEVLINLWRIQETCEESVFQSVPCNVVFKWHFMSLLNCFIQQSIDKIRLLKATQIKYSYLKNKQLLFIQFDRK